MRVQGQLVPVGAQVLILNLSRSGFAVVSRLAFAPGATLDFRLIAETGVSARVTAEAVHTRPRAGVPGEHVTGFKFVPGRMTGIIPLSSIDKLIDAVTPAGEPAWRTCCGLFTREALIAAAGPCRGFW